MKKILALVACLCLTTYLTGCTSQEETPNPDQPAAVEGGLENPNAATPPADGKTGDAQKAFLDQPLPEDSLGQAPAPLPSIDEPAAPPAPDAGQASTPPAAQPPAEMTTPATDSQPSAIAGMGTETPAPKPAASLQKVKEAPFREGDQLLNAVYVARPGDDYKKISSMIYGNEDQVKSLKAANSGIKKVKPGQKIYYNSPKRPTDESKMMNYYEESGMPAEMYVAKKGDNLKKVSESLLGFPEAWKEVWSTNTVESKGKLKEGTEIKYWKGQAAGMPEIAKGADGAPQMPASPPPAEMAKNEMPPPPPMPEQKSQAELPPPPPPPPSQAQAELPPPPPPPPQAQAELSPPPPPPPPVAPQMTKKPAKPAADAAAAEEMDQDTVMMLGAIGLVAIAGATLFIIRKKKAQKEAAQNFEQMGA